MPGYKKAIKFDTLTFVNKKMTHEEVIDLFHQYGLLRYVNKFMDRYFVQFENPSDARLAQSKLGRIYRVAYAHAKSTPRPRKNSEPLGHLVKLSYPADLPKKKKPERKSSTSGLAMIEEYIHGKTWKYKPPVLTSSEEASSNEDLREKYKGSKTGREMSRGSQNSKGTSKDSEKCKETAETSENQPQESEKENQHGDSASPEPNASKVQDPEHDDADGTGDNIEEPEAQQLPNEEGEAGEDECEQEEEEDDDQDQDEEDDQQAQARALGAGTRRRVRIEGLDQVMQELGNDMAHSVIVANIPERYTLDEVYDLVEEVKPIAFSEMDYSVKLRVKFCEVFVNDAADVDYLKQKLNDFVICGKQLTVMEPAEILDETRWNA